jgi:2-amino-4-hydroxy-6-hydroxymethyldihydropteridine diphosphokinase
MASASWSARFSRPAGLNSTPLVAIALGSNLGDRDAHLDYALARLSHFLSNLRTSSRYDTKPVDVVGEQPRYLNAAVVGQTALDVKDLFAAMQDIEQTRGRERPYPNAPRTLDLDLLLYGDAVVSAPTLVVPHPRFRERRFVLEPLAEVAPELVDPVTGLTIRELLDRLPPEN